MEKMGKKKWSKPECNRVNLVPEEAVLAGCKTGGAPVGPGGKAPCMLKVGCVNAAS